MDKTQLVVDKNTDFVIAEDENTVIITLPEKIDRYLLEDVKKNILDGSFFFYFLVTGVYKCYLINFSF